MWYVYVNHRKVCIVVSSHFNLHLTDGCMSVFATFPDLDAASAFGKECATSLEYNYIQQ
jgi:hypothetical protein